MKMKPYQLKLYDVLELLDLELLDPRFKHYTLKSASNKQNVKFLFDFFFQTIFVFNEITGS
jgi:hypothetical protein